MDDDCVNVRVGSWMDGWMGDIAMGMSVFPVICTVYAAGREQHTFGCLHTKGWKKRGDIFWGAVFMERNSYLVDPASSHMLVSKIKPCMCKYKLFCTVKLRMAH